MLRFRWLLSLLALLILLLSACGGRDEAPTGSEAGAQPAAQEGEQPAGGGTVRIGWSGSPDTLNPGVAVLSEAFTIYELVYDAMFSLQLDGTYTLELAESYEVSDDGKTWTFTIRDGILWHDGQPLTASDIAFSYNFYQSEPGLVFQPVYTDYFESVEAPDDRTVVIRLTEPIPNMESQLIFLYVLPQHIWEEQVGKAVDFENAEMIGSGPFKLVEYAQSEFVRLETNRDYFLEPAKVDGVVFQSFENQDALVQALRTGQLDMITEMPPTAVPTLRNEANVQLVSGPPLAPSVTDIIFNLTTPETCPEDGVCSGHPALLDLNVRQALAHAADKQNIIDVVLLGLGAPGLTLIPDSLGIWYNDTIEEFPFDIAKANQILDEAGYADADGDGVREMPDGSRSLVFRLNWPNDSSNLPRVAELLSSSWSQIGVKVEPQALDPDALTSICCPTFDYDILIWGWGSDPDPSFLLSVMISDEIATGTSETGYSNPEYDALFLEQASELDPDRRRQLVWQMQEIVHRDVVYLIPYYAQAVQAFRTDTFTGWQTDKGKIALDDPTSLTVIEPVQ